MSFGLGEMRGITAVLAVVREMLQLVGSLYLAVYAFNKRVELYELDDFKK